MKPAEPNALLELVLAAGRAPDPVGESILDAALAEFLDYGLRRASVDSVARRAGVSRATVYRRFENKDVLVQAVLVRECRRFFGSVADAVAQLPTARERLVEGFVVGMRYTRRDPLLSRLLSTDPEALLPYLTVNGGLVVAVARDFLVGQAQALPDGDKPVAGREPAGVAELFVRLAISFTLTPDSCIPLDDDESVRAFAISYLAVLMGPGGVSPET
ncbi:TetR/AcrR family transcriptional regulator [Kibdelosporangium persicum]|uniref:DNA-binding transcriptional regulator, AcrR family n=1 Tax=Kibdelosporangium persicum TaxID=2698649 RepID=A0ABX2EZH7_9PSEU|nr:TetR/AcrR family transcriptional regulator [Kibdelosporangium persicum]NRN64156.1 DNA-binding transcriptional regulator, AcrR family [Kibdelosporangium persicum]